MQQLKLNIDAIPHATLLDFNGPSWQVVMDHIRQLHLGMVQHLYVYGDAGVGKTHLLHAICESYYDIGKTAIQVPLLTVLNAPTEAIDALSNYDLIALDDIETIDGILNWQKAIFDLINLSREGQGQIIFSSRFAPFALKLQLADLQSRINQAVSLALPTGEYFLDRQALVQHIMQQRGWYFHPNVVEYLLLNGPKRTDKLIKMLYRLQDLLQGTPKLKYTQRDFKHIYAMIDQYRD